MFFELRSRQERKVCVLRRGGGLPASLRQIHSIDSPGVLGDKKMFRLELHHICASPMEKNCAWSQTSGLKSQAACDVYVDNLIVVLSCSNISVAQENYIVIKISGDIEVYDQTYAYLPTEAVKKLISLYKDNEQDMENPLKKKKDVMEKSNERTE